MIKMGSGENIKISLILAAKSFVKINFVENLLSPYVFSTKGILTKSIFDEKIRFQIRFLTRFV